MTKTGYTLKISHGYGGETSGLGENHVSCPKSDVLTDGDTRWLSAWDT